jgi:hypothetical protein
MYILLQMDVAKMIDENAVLKADLIYTLIADKKRWTAKRKLKLYSRAVSPSCCIRC